MTKFGKIILLVFIVLALIVARLLLVNEVPAEGPPVVPIDQPETPVAPEVIPDRTTIIENLTIPWGIAFLPGGDILVSERAGRLVRFVPDTGQSVTVPVSEVKHSGEGGLLGIALHPNFETNHYLYTYLTSELGDTSSNQVVRYRYENDRLSDRKLIIGDIPGSLFHNGGRIAFGPDSMLYIATGDARNPDSAQDINSLAGKILRVKDDGSIPSSNPIGTAVYSYGHRNPQGLAWDDDGQLWSTEHGRSGALSGFDELNKVEVGKNYGWPESQGDEVRIGTVAPSRHSTASVTWAPGGAAYINGSIFFGGLRGETLYEAKLEKGKVKQLEEHFAGELGRIRTTVVGPDGMLYITTSNRDGRGTINEGDDKVIRLNPSQFGNL